MLTVLDLFSGIGGFSLGLERTGGFKTVAFCESDPYCQSVLIRHWPGVPIFDDICFLNPDSNCERELQPERIERQERRRLGNLGIDLICGGFPCQDISVAGKGAGLAGARSGLWREYLRLIRELRPRYVVVENVSALLSRGLGTVLGDLATVGYDAEWHCIPASHVGAPHRRDRVWVVAYPESGIRQREASRKARHAALRSKNVAHAHTAGFQERFVRAGVQGTQGLSDNGQDAPLDGWWAVEPNVGRVAHGVPARVDRLKALGNAIVPQIAEMIGHAILNA